jgi:hypothetical protein
MYLFIAYSLLTVVPGGQNESQDSWRKVLGLQAALEHGRRLRGDNRGRTGGMHTYVFLRALILARAEGARVMEILLGAPMFRPLPRESRSSYITEQKNMQFSWEQQNQRINTPHSNARADTHRHEFVIRRFLHHDE